MRRLLTRFARRRRHRVDDDVPRADRFGFLDLLTEATSDIGTRPGRLSMTVAGTVLGIAALVATIGFSQTATDQIARQFDAASATQIVVTPAKTSSQGGTSVATARLPWDAPERVERLAGVEAAALSTKVDLGTGTISAVSVDDPSAPTILSPALFAASAGVLDMVGGHLVAGRSFDDGHDRRGDRVALLGASAAAKLGVDRIDTQPSIFIDGVAYAVIGIFDGVDTAGELLDAAVVPNGAARRDFGVRAPGDLRARIAVGAGPQLRDQVPLTLSPDAPETIVVGAPPGTSELSTGVQSDVGFVFVLLGVIVLLAGGLGIANVTMMSVMERVTEIGLRRALGATRRQIAGQFVIESIVIGTLGGLIGSSLGVFAVVGVSVAQQWTPVLDPLVAVGGALLGAVVGLVAGGIPARRAARIEPVDALRGS
ncbi:MULTISPECIES: ABC transporter permease [Microbacterium]|uniref:ABC transporter permease n=1 Tax=Microbacterium TaxID=33882 RepID=UPI0027822BBB|nr:MULTISPECIES: ABC transporter permease [Microbacterium]MDQ1076029.1 putative ABC transport system permease protein [Microbacterium sp. SORGH_AS_0969]MDQ1116268.1 putative ABC transport system permease protein [Microbacterium testaceum]